MNKTVSINIRGIIFNIEEEAYHQLSQYLESLKSYLGKSMSRDEIISDIEARIAELFSEKLSDRNQVVTLADVENVIAIMGQPEEYMIDEEDLEKEETQETASNFSTESIDEKKLKRRVYRNPDDKIAGGVLSGFASYFDVDPLWWRLIFVVIFFLGWGSPIFLYFILWMIIPEARTRAEKLQMRGEAVTVENLKRTIEQETEHIRKKAAGLSDDSAAEKFRTGVQEIFHFFEAAVRVIVKVFAKILGIFFGFGGLAMALFLIIAWFLHLTTGPNDNNTMHENPFSDFFGMFPATETDGTLIQYGALLLFVSMSLGMLLLGLRILFKQLEHLRKYRLGLILGAVALLGGVMLISGSVRTAMDYREQEVVNDKKTVNVSVDTLTLSVNESSLFTNLSYRRMEFGHGDIRVIDKTIHSRQINLDIQRVDSLKDVEIKTEIYARGKNSADAAKRARNIRYTYIADSTGHFVFEPVFQYSTADKYRDQEIDITIYLPVGKSIYLSPGTERIINNIKNVTDTWDPDMVGHTWKMTPQGLSCPDFTKEAVR